MRSIWRIEMFGRLQAESEHLTISRFRTRRVGLLLAYLAYYPKRRHSREELADMLWPDGEVEASQRNLRQALSSLRHHLEPPPIPAGAIIVAKQGLVSFDSELISTDVAEFNHLIEAAEATPSNTERLVKLSRAIDLYRGDFLPGYYEDWVQRERLHLEDQFVSALQSLVQALTTEGKNEEAIRYVRLALAKDHLREDFHASLMRLYLACGRPHSALQHFRELRETLAEELNEEPGATISELASKAEREAGGQWNPLPTNQSASNDEADAAPVSDSEPIASNLPIQLTRFFGRGSERTQIAKTLSDHRSRLVTLIGTAGSGKTRLSIEVGRDMAQIHGWNVWFVPLADVSDGSMAHHVLSESLRLQAEPGSDPIEVLNGSLSGVKNLIILDNLEHLVDSVAPFVDSLLRKVPQLSILTTSRQALKLAGEHEIDLATLPIPDPDQIGENDLRELSTVPSIQLFLDRAQAIVPDFQITRHNARSIASICIQLDGLPLALEFAAGISNSFTPAQILQNLESRLEILRNRRRDIPNRHRTLRAAIDYSYDLLTPELKRFFAHLSVFRGGFTIEAAAKVCLPCSCAFDGPCGEKGATEECLGMILDLRERSLLRMDASNDESAPARFRLLESFREYGIGLIEAADFDPLRQRHAEYYLNLPATPNVSSVDEVSWDRDNRLAALRTFEKSGRISECVRILYTLRGYSQAGRPTILALCKSPDFDSFPPMDQIMLLRLMADAQLYPSEFEESYAVSMRGLEIARKHGLEDQEAICHRSVAAAAVHLGRLDEAIAHDEHFLAYGLKAQNPLILESAYSALGTNHWTAGDLHGALEVFCQGMAVSKFAHDGEPMWPLLYNLARVHLDLGNLDDGLQLASDGLRQTQRRNEEFGISMFLALIARHQLKRGSFHAALATNREVLTKRRKIGFRYWTLCALQTHAAVLAALDRFTESATLLAASRDTLKLRRKIDDDEYAATIERVKKALPLPDFEEAWARGIAIPLEDAYRLAVATK
ncbi:MAG: hypothetical protein GC165_07225 [Armatimonadetes bacterium]|nr:hypothetical protein [Armatimonadota bacterium]